MNKEQTPKEMLWLLTKQGNDIMNDLVYAEREEARSAKEYYTTRSRLMVSDMVQGLKSQDLRDAEVRNMMDIEPITERYQEDKVKANQARRKFELFDIMSRNLRTLLSYQKGIEENEKNHPKKDK